MRQKPESDITPDSHFKTKLSTLVVAIVAVCGSVWHAGREFTKFTQTLEDIQNFIEVGWDYQMEEDIWTQVAIDNPNFKVPDVDRIRQRRIDVIRKRVEVSDSTDGVVSAEDNKDIPIP